MKRRLFLQFPFVAAPLSLFAKPPLQDRTQKGIFVAADKDRFNEDLTLTRKGARIDCKVSTKDTEGDLYIYESRTEEKGGPPLHRHLYQDEFFHIVQGEYIIKVGEDTFRAKPGDSVFAPRMIPHAFSFIGTGVGKMMIVFQPAGKMEAFFHEVHNQKTLPSPEEDKKRFPLFDMEWMGPRLPVEQ